MHRMRGQTDDEWPPEARLTGALSTRNCYMRLIAVAREQIITSRHSSFTVQDIATATGLSRRAIYNHFPNPEALRRAAIREILDELRDAAEIDLRPEEPPATAIAHFAQFCCDIFASDRNLAIWCAITGVSGGEEWIAASYIRLVRQPLIRSFEIYLLQRHARDAALSIDAHRAAEQFVGMLEAACVIPRLLGQRAEPPDTSEIGFATSTFLEAHFRP